MNAGKIRQIFYKYKIKQKILHHKHLNMALSVISDIRYELNNSMNEKQIYTVLYTN